MPDQVLGPHLRSQFIFYHHLYKLQGEKTPDLAMKSRYIFLTHLLQTLPAFTQGFRHDCSTNA